MRSPKRAEELVAGVGDYLWGMKSPERAEERVVAGNTDLWGMKSPERAEERVVAGNPPGAADTARDRLPRPRLFMC